MKNLRIICLFFPFVLVFLTVLICFLNYTPGTFLTGWDTLHPEFNFQQQFSNMFFGVFRTDQGLGAVAAHSHMADLPRVILLWLFSFIMPLSFLRYSIIFLSFILGPLGIYFFVKHTLLKTSSQFSVVSCQLSALLGALVYIFNLGTVQHFYVPFEMFTVQYAALPWLFFFALKFIEKPRVKNLLLFSAVTFLASPMAYASVLWYAHFAFLLLFLATYWSLKRSKKAILISLALIITTLAINAYWILPNMYFLTNKAGSVSLAQTNKIFSDEAFLYNKQYGNILNTAILRNFLFSWTQQKDIHTTEDLMTPWKIHLKSPFVSSIGYAVFIISFIGILLSLIKKNTMGIAFIPGFLFSLIMVVNMNPPFEPLFSFLRDNSAIFREALRFPYTKFSILLMFSLSFFFAFACFQILRILEKPSIFRLNRFFATAIALALSTGLIFYGLPMFQGKLINSRMRISIPNNYFELFDYLAKEPQSNRVALLPLQSIWGWEYYNWSYQGAGFIWFGIKQPVLARDFDRWNPDNEQYFREMSSAIYSREVGQVETLARKYRISYFLLDESVVFPGYKQNALWHYETKDTFEKSTNIKLVKKFGHLSLYRVDGYLTSAGYVQKPRNITFVGPKITGGFVDIAAQNLGDYVVSPDPVQDEPDFVYFSRSLVNRYDRVDPANVSFLGNTLLLKLGKNKEYSLTDSWLSNDIFPEFMRSSYDLAIEEKGLPFIVDDDQFIFFPVTSNPISVPESLDQSEDCGRVFENSISQIVKQKDFVTFRAKTAASCGFILFPSAKQDFGSLLIVEARNKAGLPIRLCISENITNRCSIYTALDSGNSWKRYVFMIPPQPSGASGYAVHFNTIGIGNDESENDVSYAQLIQIPYYRIANLTFIKDGYKHTANGITKLDTQEINPTLYKADVRLLKDHEGLVALYKGYDSGWKGYLMKNNNLNFLDKTFPFLTGKEVKNHILVNDWANGWLLPANRSQSTNYSIVIVYLPQYLEYAGFAILIITFAFIVSRFAISKA